MKFRYSLPDTWITKVAYMEPFANGATQVTIRLKDGRVIPEAQGDNDPTGLMAADWQDRPEVLVRGGHPAQ